MEVLSYFEKVRGGAVQGNGHQMAPKQVRQQAIKGGKKSVIDG